MTFGDISNIYNILANDAHWFEKMDANNDGIIIKAEFVNYLGDFEGWDGTNKATQDLIDKFWKRFDCNKSKENIQNTFVSNFNALDAQEINKMSKEIALCKQVYDVFETAYNNLNLDNPNNYPTGLKEPFLGKWKKSIKKELGDYFFSLYAEAQNNGKVNEWLEDVKNNDIIKAKFDSIKYDFSIIPYAEQYLNELSIQDLNIYGYKFKNYQLTSIILNEINKNVEELDDSDKNYDNINKIVKQVIDDFDSNMYFNKPITIQIEGINQGGVVNLYTGDNVKNYNINVNNLPKELELTYSVIPKNNFINVQNGSLSIDPNQEFNGEVILMATFQKGNQLETIEFNFKLNIVTQKVDEPDTGTKAGTTTPSDGEIVAPDLRDQENVIVNSWNVKDVLNSSEPTYLELNARYMYEDVIKEILNSLCAALNDNVNYTHEAIQYAYDTTIDYYSSLSTMYEIDADYIGLMSFIDGNGDFIEEKVDVQQYITQLAAAKGSTLSGVKLNIQAIFNKFNEFIKMYYNSLGESPDDTYDTYRLNLKEDKGITVNAFGEELNVYDILNSDEQIILKINKKPWAKLDFNSNLIGIQIEQILKALCANLYANEKYNSAANAIQYAYYSTLNFYNSILSKLQNGETNKNVVSYGGVVSYENGDGIFQEENVRIGTYERDENNCGINIQTIGARKQEINAFLDIKSIFTKFNEFLAIYY